MKKRFNETYSVIFLKSTNMDNLISANNYSTYESALLAAKQEIRNGNKIISITENFSKMELEFDHSNNEIKVNYSYPVVGFYQDLKNK